MLLGHHQITCLYNHIYPTHWKCPCSGSFVTYIHLAYYTDIPFPYINIKHPFPRLYIVVEIPMNYCVRILVHHSQPNHCLIWTSINFCQPTTVKLYLCLYTQIVSKPPSISLHITTHSEATLNWEILNDLFIITARSDSTYYTQTLYIWIYTKQHAVTTLLCKKNNI